MPRIARIIAIDYPHHIVQRGNNRQQIFFDDQDYGFYRKLLKKYSSEGVLPINSYCLMNNHVHILATPRTLNSLAKMMQKLSLRYTQYVNKKYKRTGRLWESRFFSSIVDKDTYIWTVCKYIERNPVRAHIVQFPHEYKWSSVNSTDKDFIQSVWQTEKEKNQYNKFLYELDNSDDVEMIQKRAMRSKPVGGDEFIDKLRNSFGDCVLMKSKGRPRKE